MKILKTVGMIIGIIALILAFYWYDWRLALIIFLALTGNNLNQIQL